VIDSTQVKWARHVAGIAAKLNANIYTYIYIYIYLSKNLKLRDHVKDLKVGGGNNINTYLKEAGCGIMDLNDVV
jgi:hypothetical protein